MNYRTVSNTGNASPYLQMPPKIAGVGAPEASIDERIRSALRFIPVGSHDVRVRVAFMLKSVLGEDGREIWDVWREGRGDDEANSVWRSASESGALTIGSLFHEAKANGWRDDGQYRKPSLAETAERKRIAVERAAKQAAIDARRRQEAASLAHEEWAKAQPCLRHPYTVTKCIRAHGTRFNIDSLMVPLRDADGAMHSMQYIRPNGDKKFMPGGRVRGCFYLIGVPENVLCIAEGFATGASVHEATGHAVAVAFNAGNLLPVAIALRSKYPDLNIIICADDDHQTPGNPGLTKAKEAARQVGGLLAVPKFGECRQGTAKDFNDMHVDEQFGLDAVRACIASARLPDEGGAIEAGIPASHIAQAANDDTQSCSYGGGRFETSERGVFFIGTDKDGNEKHPIWVCSALRVMAMTRDGKSGEWGRLLEWRDADGVRHQWAMPLELTQGDGSDVRRELARFGVQISPSRSARDLLASYIQVWPVEARARCVDRLGWHGGVYVTPSESIGQHEEIVVFQNAQALEPSHAACGTVGEWRNSVGRLAAGNSRLVFALSVAFAGALADVAGEDSGGFHLRGKSSSGKSTALKVAASAWGNPAAYPRLWRATSNGLEGLAALHNDGLLILDELSQMEPKEAGESAYLLANGQGKARASRTGTARQSARWRLLFLSAGEESLSALMARAGKKPNAGQEIRLADIEADAGAGMGAFETLHDAASPAALALAIKDAAAKFHGAVGIQWLRHIVEDRQKLAEFVSNGIKQFVEEFAPPEASGQVIRVARRFGLVAVAGELASHYGLTGWDEGEAIGSVSKCFLAWLDAFGGAGNREDRTILEHVRAFIAAHGASRFEDMHGTGDHRVPNRVGFFRSDNNGTRDYLIPVESFRREVCSGFDPKAVADVLLKAGWLVPGEGSRSTQKPRLPGMGPVRCYVLTAGMWKE